MGELLDLGPEITNPISTPGMFKLATDANWMADGHVLLKPQEQLRFVVESMYRLNNYLFHQLPPGYSPNIDRDLFYNAFSIQDVDVLSRTPSSSGQDQPTRIIASPELIQDAQATLDLWQSQVKERAAFIPLCSKSSLPNQLSNMKDYAASTEIVPQGKFGTRFVRDNSQSKVGAYAFKRNTAWLSSEQKAQAWFEGKHWSTFI
ncbi:hypothetical protein BDN72DRAFT_907139 [Pluteus cervinus]|uniref:Uncharacterized protein n=1 Tax=Pluteus cervinus TaxID=181527 RepID=A0ACD2ZXG7_9AGAR|nr:hypothetical protein BDN72DRAFT_907139 [Pluteus cervinus]